MMIPAFVFFLLNGNVLISAVIFIAASITDGIDGYIARKRNMITNLGKLMDPLADKVLVVSALICFVEVFWWVPAWTVLIIIAREFIVTGFRLSIVAGDNKAVIAADIWGKIKTAFTMGVIIFILVLKGAFEDIYVAFFHPQHLETINKIYHIFENVSFVLICMVTAITVFSGFTMIWKNRSLFSE